MNSNSHQSPVACLGQLSASSQPTLLLGVLPLLAASRRSSHSLEGNPSDNSGPLSPKLTARIRCVVLRERSCTVEPRLLLVSPTTEQRSSVLIFSFPLQLNFVLNDLERSATLRHWNLVFSALNFTVIRSDETKYFRPIGSIRCRVGLLKQPRESLNSRRAAPIATEEFLATL